MQEGKIKPSDLSDELIDRTYKELNGGASKGYGKGWEALPGNTQPSRSAILMQRNIYQFSGAKTYTMLQELNSKLVKDGKTLGWEDFKAEALKINQAYNLNYLQAEYQTAVHASRMAAQWEAYQSNKVRFPNLKYKTQGDDRVREEHQKLDGIVAPIDDPFWDRYYPPNGWRCRCYVVQTAAEVSEALPEDVPQVKEEFRMNAGKSNQVYNKDGKKPHRFFQIAKRDSKGNSNLAKAFELTKLNAPLNKGYQGKKGGSVEVSPFTDLKELNRNYEVAKLMADQLGSNVQLRAHLDGRIITNQANPEYQIDGKLADRKSPSGIRGIKNGLSGAEKQGCETVVFDLENFTLGKERMIDALKISLNNPDNYPSIKEVILVDGEKIDSFKRDSLVNKKDG